MGVGKDLRKTMPSVKEGLKKRETDQSCKAIGTGDTDHEGPRGNRRWKQAPLRKQLRLVGS